MKIKKISVENYDEFRKLKREAIIKGLWFENLVFEGTLLKADLCTKDSSIIFC